MSRNLAAERMLRDAPVPWSVELGQDSLHALVDGNGKLVARSPMLGWLEAIAAIVNDDWASQSARLAAVRGPVHDLDAGRYRALVREGVPVIERADTAGAVRAVLVPCSPQIVAELSADWSEPVQWRIEDGLFVFRTV